LRKGALKGADCLAKRLMKMEGACPAELEARKKGAKRGGRICGTNPKTLGPRSVDPRPIGSESSP